MVYKLFMWLPGNNGKSLERDFEFGNLAVGKFGDMGSLFQMILAKVHVEPSSQQSTSTCSAIR